MVRSTANKRILLRKEKIWAVIFVAPMIFQFLVFTLGSLIFSGYYSLTSYNAISNEKLFIWFQNYGELFKDENFLKAIGNTLYLMLGLPIGIVLGVLLASALNKKMAGQKLFRVIYYLPAVSSIVAVGIVWRFIYNAEFGVLNRLLGINVKWLYDPKVIKLAIIIKNIWLGLGSTMLLYLAAMQNVPRSYYEAADIDGAGPIVKFFKITAPMLTPVTFYIIITGVIGGLNSFADSYVMTGAGTGYSAATIVYYMWQKMQDGYYGIVSAAAFMLSVCVFLITLLQFKLSKRWVYND